MTNELRADLLIILTCVIVGLAVSLFLKIKNRSPRMTKVPVAIGFGVGILVCVQSLLHEIVYG